MQKNKSKLANLKMLQFMANKLDELVAEVVFIGGSTTALFITDDNVPDVRFTVDVDCIVDVASLKQYHDLEKLLIEKGFKQSIMESVICRWFYEGAVLDIMPTDEKILGFGNPWYKLATKHRTQYELEDKTIINVITAPYFLATKLAAFHDRGKNDYFSSHDFEDIITVIDGRVELTAEIKNSDPSIRKFINKEFDRILADNHFHDALPGHLTYYGDQINDRAKIIVNRIKSMIGE